jgi:amino acid adenylation domain-containing protein
VRQGAMGSQPTPSDYGLGRELDHTELDAFLKKGILADGLGYVLRGERVEGMCRLSALQEGMLFHGLYERTEAYIEQLGCTIKGLDEVLFRKSWKEVMRRHSILRSGFYPDDFRIPVQCVYRDVNIPIEMIDLWGKEVGEQQRLIVEYASGQRQQGFDVREAPLMRIGLLRLDADRYRMIWTYHHILLDGWSLPVLIEELLDVYTGLAADGVPAMVEDDRYEDYIRYIEGSEKEREEAYWREYLRGLEGRTLLPFMEGSPGERNKGIGEYAEEILRLEEPETAALQRYAQRHQVTVNTVVQGIWALLIYRYTGNRQVVYGVIVSGRPEQLSGIEKRVGLYINTLPLYTVVEQERVLADWLRSIQTGQSESRQYQHTALPEIQRWLGVQGDWFDSLLVFENYPMSKAIQSYQHVLDISEIAMQEHSNYPLSVTINSAEDTQVRFSYNRQLLDAGYVQQLRDQFAKVLQEIIGRLSDSCLVGDIAWLPEKERNELLRWSAHCNHRRAVSGDGEEFSWLDRWSAQIQRTPDATVIIHKDERLSYRQADIITQRLAWYFRQQLGLKKGDRVVVLIERSEWILLVLLSLMKSRLVYVPVDTDYPDGRIGFILENVQPALIITEKKGLAGMDAFRCEDLSSLKTWLARPAAFDEIADEGRSDPEDEAYIIYTSGSTGKPKGVVVAHRGLNHFLGTVCREFTEAGPLTLPFIASHAFDISLFQLLTPVLSGGACVIVAREELQDVERLAQIITEVTAIDTVPALFDLIVNNLYTHPERPGCRHIKRIFIGGDVIPDELLRRLRETFSAAVITVTYGPTEGAIFCAYTEYAPANDALHPLKGSVIGRPLGQSELYIVDQHLGLLPAGAPGEICIGGPGVAKGYWRNPELTAAKFAANPFAAEARYTGFESTTLSAVYPLYRTGDIGCWTKDGMIEFRGRSDEQVKIRGFRVEPGEVEIVLLQSGEVSRAVVLAKRENDNNKRLVAFVVPNGGYNQDKMFSDLRRQLPEYMIPSLVVELTEMPLTANGKIDKAVLLQMAEKGHPDREYKAPRTDLEQQLADIWQNLLGIQQIGIYDNFFELGGHSLLVTRLASAIRKQLGMRMAIRLFFQLTTIESMARFIMINRKHDQPVGLEDYRAVKI